MKKFANNEPGLFDDINAKSYPWQNAISSLISIYGSRKHPLDYKNLYQLVVMVILSAQDSDAHINSISQSFFNIFPTLLSLAESSYEDLHTKLHSVRNYENKIKWLKELAMKIGNEKNIPVTLTELVKLPGIGRKSANLIIRETGGEAEGIIVDLHVMRVAPRIGIASGTSPEKIERQLMASIPKTQWNEIGMALSFLGREICRPTHPKCIECPVSKECVYNKV